MVRPHIYSSTIFVIFPRALLAIPKGRSEVLSEAPAGTSGGRGGVDSLQASLPPFAKRVEGSVKERPQDSL